MPSFFSLHPSAGAGRGAGRGGSLSSSEDDECSYSGDLAGSGMHGSGASLDGSGTVNSAAFSLPDDFLVDSSSASDSGGFGSPSPRGESRYGDGFVIRIPPYNKNKPNRRTSRSKRTFCLYTLLIIVCGGIASSAFLILGVNGADKDQFRRFEKQASELVVNILGKYQEYETSALWIHESCHVPRRERGVVLNTTIAAICTRVEFFELYQYLLAGGLSILAAQFIPRVQHAQREQFENESRAFYEDQFDQLVDFQGVTGLENLNDEEVLADARNADEEDFRSIYHTVPRPVMDEYFPIHYMAPIRGNEQMIELDLLSSTIRKRSLDIALETRLPTLSSRLLCYDDRYSENGHDDEQDHEHHDDAYDDEVHIIPGHYTLMLLHPGIALQDAFLFVSSEQDNLDASHQHSDVVETENNSGPHNTEEDDPFYSIPTSIASVQISIMELLRDATSEVTEHIKIFLYETNGSTRRPTYTYLGGADVAGVDDDDYHDHDDSDDTVHSRCTPPRLHSDRFHPFYETDVSIDRARSYRRVYEDVLIIGNRKWTVVIVAGEGSFGANFLFFILGASFIMIACLCIALWFYSSMHRARVVNNIRAQARSEKAAMIIENSREAAKAERELNDFLAHEVRNPLSAAIAASSFVSAEVNEVRPLITEESKLSVREDMNVIHSSLQFINDLLRNILDMHRASSQQMTIELAPTDVRADVLDPVATMLYKRGNSYQVELECPSESMIIMTDKLRLKQIVLNLASNARKFISKGFIRLRAELDAHGTVVISVEDSGSGIPEEKRKQLFCKFQESLDSLSQGTGIGLALCKHLSKLLGGELALDDSYDSGIEGYPGARFVIHLNTEPIEDFQLHDHHDDVQEGEGNGNAVNGGKLAKTTGALPTAGNSDEQTTEPADSSDSSQHHEELPQHLKVLFVDDDFVLRKLFMRSIKRVAPNWDVSEAANGETALRMTEADAYDVIFLDQYMASVEKQLLGTETARAMRSKGVRSKICGLSANDMGDAFLQSGATSFMMKPFPCQKEPLTEELLRVIYRPDVNIDFAFGDVDLVMPDVDGDGVDGDARLADAANAGDQIEIEQDRVTDTNGETENTDSDGGGGNGDGVNGVKPDGAMKDVKPSGGLFALLTE